MSKWDKLIQKILTLSRDIRFEELRKVLESMGYTMTTPSGGSSHHTFRKTGVPPVSIARHSRIKRVYIEAVAEIIKKEMDDDEDA